MEDQYFGAGREGANKTANGGCDEEPKTFIKNGIKISSNSNTRRLKGLGYFFGGMFGSLAVFELTYWVVASLNIHWIVGSTDLNFLIKSVIGVIFAALAIKAFDGATGDMPTLMSKPVAYFTIIIFVFSLFAGYQHGQGESAGWLGDTLFGKPQIPIVEQVVGSQENQSIPTSEFGKVSSVGEIWRTKRSFKAGTNVTIRVRGGSVQIMDGSLLESSDYNVSVSTDETIAFVGISDNHVTIEVIY